MARKMFAHRYKWTHEKRRKKLRKMHKDGKIKRLSVCRDGFLYEIPDGVDVGKI